MQHWIETPVDKGWENAEEEFRATIDYPHEILSAILHVLRTGQFQDGTPVSLSRWPFLAKFDMNRIGVKATCTHCTQTYWISPRAIYTLPPTLLRFRCTDLSIPCRKDAISSTETLRQLPAIPETKQYDEMEQLPPESYKEEGKPETLFYTAPSYIPTYPRHFSRQAPHPEHTWTSFGAKPKDLFGNSFPYSTMPQYVNPSFVLPNTQPFPSHHPIDSYPHPSQFIVGKEAHALKCPGP